MWALADELSSQTKWAGEWRSPSTWVTIFVAAITGVQLVPGYDGSAIPTVRSSRDLTKEEMSEVIELMQFHAAENDVVIHGE